MILAQIRKPQVMHRKKAMFHKSKLIVQMMMMITVLMKTMMEKEKEILITVMTFQTAASQIEAMMNKMVCLIIANKVMVENQPSKQLINHYMKMNYKSMGEVMLLHWICSS